MYTHSLDYSSRHAAQNFGTTPPTRYMFDAATNEDTFGELIINDAIRDIYRDPSKRATAADALDVVEYVRARACYKNALGALDYLSTKARKERAYRSVLRTVKKLVYFTTRSGLIGRGHLETQAGDEV
ncbi:hypothetical protein LY76DRAFT_604930 [Colletotrichum caudatum]|nr:hypothetical protein LY76DRAFT_604930 [Colletotrichum caudatum]